MIQYLELDLGVGTLQKGRGCVGIAENRLCPAPLPYLFRCMYYGLSFKCLGILLSDLEKERRITLLVP